MNKITLICFLVFSVNLVLGQNINREIVVWKDSMAIDSAGYQLAFYDEFDDLDEEIWNIRRGLIRNPEVELQCYTRENVFTQNGLLYIVAQKDSVRCKDYTKLPWGSVEKDFEYTSANIETKERFLFGVFEARVKVPYGACFWPAFWLYGPKSSHLFFKDTIPGEIDIFEFYFQESGVFRPANWGKKHYFTTHTRGYEPNDGHNYRTFKISSEDLTNAFHTYRMEWTPLEIKYFIDGEHQLTIPNFSYRFLNRTVNVKKLEEGDKVKQNYNYPSNPMMIIFNFAIKNEQECKIEQYLPAHMIIDYIKVWQKTDNYE